MQNQTIDNIKYNHTRDIRKIMEQYMGTEMWIEQQRRELENEVVEYIRQYDGCTLYSVIAWEDTNHKLNITLVCMIEDASTRAVQHDVTNHIVLDVESNVNATLKHWYGGGLQ